MIARIRAWRLQRAELALADAEYHLGKWRFSNSPSEDHRERKRIDRLRRRVAALADLPQPEESA